MSKSLRSLLVAPALLAGLLQSPALLAQAIEAPRPAEPPTAGAAAPAGPALRRATPAPRDHTASPVAHAVRTTGPISVDAQLDEADWTLATPITEFWQFDPDEGAPVSEPTEVRFLYDDEAIYVGAWLYDREGTMPTRLGRRDVAMTDTEIFVVHFDSYHDHRTSYRLAINPSGAKRDLVISGGGGGGTGGLGGGDSTWDPVWEVKTRIAEEGWYVEMRVPFSQLRFSRDEEQVWGLQVERKLRPGQENTVWVFTPKTEAGGVPRFGHLLGIRGVRPGRKLELLPYLGGRAEYVAVAQSPDVTFANPFRSDSDYFGYGGLDMKYRITSNLTLDATVNPDFGQVEVDPAVINLTAFETRFQERRPFFIEGAEIFTFGSGGSQILYSRRIGRPPQGSVPGEAVYDGTPNTTTILGAAKLTGKTANGWSLGMLDAVTSREHASWQGIDGVTQEHDVEPLANYFAGRARREMRGGWTTVGGLFTAVHRDLSGSPLEGSLRSSAYSGGVDFGHEWANRVWSLDLQFSPSYVAGSTSAMIATQRSSARYYQRPDADYLQVDSAATALFGYWAQAGVQKQAGAWRFSAGGSAVSPGYEINDIGFQTLADRLTANGRLGYEQTRPGSHFRNWHIGLNSSAAWNYGGDRVGTDLLLGGGAQFFNFSRFDAEFTYYPEFLNGRLTRGGPLTKDPSAYAGSLSFVTDTRTALTGRAGVSARKDAAGGWSRGVNFSVALKATETLDLSVAPDVSWSRSTAQYVTGVNDAVAQHTFGRRYIFADLRQTTVSIDTRVNLTLTPEMSFQLFAQPFVSSGDYEELKELARPRTFDFTRYGQDAGTITPTADRSRYQIDPDGDGPASTFRVDNEDFNFRSLRGNAVFRWEWRPGSTLFLVWQQNRAGTLDASGGVPTGTRLGDFAFGRDAGDLFSLQPDNVFLIKVNYWLNP